MALQMQLSSTPRCISLVPRSSSRETLPPRRRTPAATHKWYVLVSPHRNLVVTDLQLCKGHVLRHCCHCHCSLISVIISAVGFRGLPRFVDTYMPPQATDLLCVHKVYVQHLCSLNRFIVVLVFPRFFRLFMWSICSRTLFVSARPPVAY